MRLQTRTDTRRTPEVRRTFELWNWLFMRVSGVILMFLTLGHLAIQHVFNDVNELSFDFVVARWSSAFWRTWDWLLLVLAVLHGVNGARVMIDDYVRRPGRRLAVFWLIYSVAFVTIALGTIVVFTFNPDAFR